MGEKRQEFIPDPGLDAQSVAAMTPEEAKEYLTLLIRYSAPGDLPSLTWLRRAAAASRRGGSQDTTPTPGNDSVTASAPQSADKASLKKLGLDKLLPLLRNAPVSFEPPPNQPLRKSRRRSRRSQA